MVSKLNKCNESGKKLTEDKLWWHHNLRRTDFEIYVVVDVVKWSLFVHHTVIWTHNDRYASNSLPAVVEGLSLKMLVATLSYYYGIVNIPRSEERRVGKECSS